MPKFGKRSKKNLEECHKDLQQVFIQVVKTIDCTVLCGYRDKWLQNHYYEAGLSKVQWPKSKHNRKISKAIDIVPWPIDWHNIERFIFFGGFVMATAEQLGVKLRWGGAWNDKFLFEQKWNDYGHFEIK